MVSVIDKAAKAEIIVPIAPTNKQLKFLHKQTFNLLDEPNEFRTTTPIIYRRTAAANPKAIHAAVTINGIKPNANSTPIIAPKIIPTIVPVTAHPPHTQLSLFVFIFINSHYHTMKAIITVLK